MRVISWSTSLSNVNGFTREVFALVALCWMALVAPSAWAHGNNGVKGEWLPVIDKNTIVGTPISAQVQSSPLGSEILIEYRGEGEVAILGDDAKPFIRIGQNGVFANWDHPMWFKVQAAGPRPLPQWVKDGKVEEQWKKVNSNNYFGWFDERLEKRDDHQHAWSINVALNGNKKTISGSFKSLTPPKERTLVTVDNKTAPIADMTALVITGVESAIHVKYAGDHHMVVLDDEDTPMFRFSPNGVEVNTESKGWKELARKPYSSDSQWVKLSSQPAYTWPDSRLQQQNDARWKIPVFCHQDKKVKFIQGGWQNVASL